MGIPAITNRPQVKYSPSFVLSEPFPDDTSADIYFDKNADPAPVLLAGPPTLNVGTLSPKKLLDEIKGSKTTLKRKIEIYKTLKKGCPGSWPLAEAMFMLAKAYRYAGQRQKAISIYSKLAKMRKFRRTKYARRAYFYLGQIYGDSNKPANIRKAIKYYTVSLNRKRPEMNVIHYYQMAHLLDVDDTKPPSRRAFRYYQLYYKSFKAYMRLYSKRSLIVNFKDKGFDLSDPIEIVETLLRLLNAYLVAGKLSSALPVLKDVRLLVDQNKTRNSLRADDVKYPVKSLFSLLEWHLLKRNISKAADILNAIYDFQQISNAEGLKEVSKFCLKASSPHLGLLVELLEGYLSRKRLSDVFKVLKILIKAANIFTKIWDKNLDGVYASAIVKLQLGINRLRGKSKRQRTLVRQIEKHIEKFKSIILDKRRGGPGSQRLMRVANLYWMIGRNDKAIALYKKAKAADLFGGQKHSNNFWIAFLGGDSGRALTAAKKFDAKVKDAMISLAGLAKEIKLDLASGGKGLVTTRVLNGIVIKRFKDYHLFIDTRKNQVSGVIQSKRLLIKRKQVVSSKQGLAVIFKSFKQRVLKNYYIFLKTIRKMPKGFYSKLAMIIFDDTTPVSEAGSCAGRVIWIRRTGGNVRTISHEIAHLWDGMNNTKMRLFRQISWKSDIVRREDDQRDFIKNCFDPAKNRHTYKYSRLKRTVPPKYIVCKDPKTMPYGMMNYAEDFAEYVEEYFNGGTALRKLVTKQMKLGNFEPILKYLFVQHITPFAGKEYGVGKNSHGITLSEVEGYFRGRLKTHPKDVKVKRSLAILEKIKYSREYYKTEGDNLRASVNNAMLFGNFTPALKYLHMKYRVYRGKEFMLLRRHVRVSFKSSPMTAAKVKLYLKAWLQKHPGSINVRTISLINNYAKRYRK
jgi:tetratricopeptide (TPR) repeat protein